jgi:hypothetical protein
MGGSEMSHPPLREGAMEEDMSFTLIFWVLMLFWLIFGLWGYYQPRPGWMYGHGLFLFILFLLLGWRVFGAPIHP